MAYVKNTWATGDTITAEKMNHMEDGIAGGGGTFDIKFTGTYDETTGDMIYSCNKTFAEITTEYQTNGYGNMRVALDYGEEGSFFNSLNFAYDTERLQAQFASTDIENNEINLFNLTLAADSQTQEDVVTYDGAYYTLTE